MSAPERERRLGGDSQAAKISADTQITSSVLPIRCSRCAHELTAARSVQRGFGPLCARAAVVVA